MRGVLPFDETFGTLRHQFVLPVDEADVLSLAAARAEGSAGAIKAWSALRNRHVRRAADPRTLIVLFDRMVAALDRVGAASPASIDALHRIRDTDIGAHSGLAISRWIERLRGLAEIRAPGAFLDYEIAAVPSRAATDPSLEAGIRWNSSSGMTTVGPAIRACVAWDVGVLGFGGIAVEGGVDAIRLAGPDWDMPLFSAEDLNQSFELPAGATLGAAVLVPNGSFLTWAERVEALPDRLPIDISHARARDVIRSWQRNQGRPPPWFLAHEDRGSPDAVPLMAITLRARWSDAWAERRTGLASRLRELAPFGFGMVAFEGKYAPAAPPATATPSPRPRR